MNCPFCNKPGLPQFTPPHSGGLFAHPHPVGEEPGTSVEFWMCPSCPTLVEFDETSYSLYCLFNNSWYEIVWLKLSKQYLIYHLKPYVNVDEENGSESYWCRRELSLQVNSEETIRPDNAPQKLNTMLTFS
jgi:hypothetical protein